MRVCLISLVLFSNLLLFPLVKNNFLQAKSIEKIQYRVKKGDNLATISRKFNVSPTDIENWNHIANPGQLKKGQRLTIYLRAREYAPIALGDTIILHKPVSDWEILKGYHPYGETMNFGLLCKVSGSAVIKPATSGVIVKISQLRGYGKYILIDHGKGWHSMYSNLDHIEVKLGQHVDLSDIIGNAKNNKLFFLLAYNGKPVNPVGYFKR